MTKAQAARRINRVFKEYNRILAETLNEILKDADMWYGESPDVAGLMPEDRNGRELAFCGPFDFSGYNHIPSEFLHTRKELGFQEKPSRETLKRKTRYNRHSRPVPA